MVNVLRGGKQLDGLTAYWRNESDQADLKESAARQVRNEGFLLGFVACRHVSGRLGVEKGHEDGEFGTQNCFSQAKIDDLASLKIAASIIGVIDSRNRVGPCPWTVPMGCGSHTSPGADFMHQSVHAGLPILIRKWAYSLRRLGLTLTYWGAYIDTS